MHAIVLAGGENRRMGTDKAFLTFRGRPLIEQVLCVLRTVCSGVTVVTNAPERYSAYDVAVVTDVVDQRGPLTGLYSGLLHAPEDVNFVAACDMPFLNAGLIAHLGTLVEGFDAVVPSIGGLHEPLHAVYQRRLAGRIGELLRQGCRDMRAVLDAGRTRYVGEADIIRFDPDRRSFRNLNTKQDYEEVLCSDSECRNWSSSC